MLRFAAEAENTQRRAEREANDARAYAIQKFARDLLGVADNLGRARAHAPTDSDDPLVKNLAVGLEMTEKELLSAFERNGLKRLDPPRGAKFDPHQHQAMMEQPADDVGPGAVLAGAAAGLRAVRPDRAAGDGRGLVKRLHRRDAGRADLFQSLRPPGNGARCRRRRRGGSEGLTPSPAAAARPRPR